MPPTKALRLTPHFAGFAPATKHRTTLSLSPCTRKPKLTRTLSSAVLRPLSTSSILPPQPYPLRPTRQLHTTPTWKAASPPPASANEPTPLGTEEYHKLADTYIETLVAELEDLQEEREEVDVEYSAGVLTLVFPPAGTYVLNKQPPNRQIWLSSPLSGPKRYDYVRAQGEGDWVYLRDGSRLSDLLRKELGIKLFVEDLDA